MEMPLLAVLVAVALLVTTMSLGRGILSGLVARRCATWRSPRGLPDLSDSPAAIQEGPFPYRSEDFRAGQLQQFVFQRRNPQWTGLSPVFWDVFPAHQFGPVRLTFQPIDEIFEVGLQILGIGRDGDPVDSGRCTFAQLPEAPPQVVFVEQVVEVAEPCLRVPFGPICYLILEAVEWV